MFSKKTLGRLNSVGCKSVEPRSETPCCCKNLHPRNPNKKTSLRKKSEVFVFYKLLITKLVILLYKCKRVAPPDMPWLLLV